jgi:hypothetical protein
MDTTSSQVEVFLYVSNIQICKILQNTDFMYQQWPHSIFLPDIIYKMHEGEIDSPHKDPLYHIFHKALFSISAWIPNIKEEKRKNINVRKMFTSYQN